MTRGGHRPDPGSTTGEDFAINQGQRILTPLFIGCPNRSRKTLKKCWKGTCVVQMMVGNQYGINCAIAQHFTDRIGVFCGADSETRVYDHRRIRPGRGDDIGVGAAQRHPGGIVLGYSGCELATSHGTGLTHILKSMDSSTNSGYSTPGKPFTRDTNYINDRIVADPEAHRVADHYEYNTIGT